MDAYRVRVCLFAQCQGSRLRVAAPGLFARSLDRVFEASDVFAQRALEVGIVAGRRQRGAVLEQCIDAPGRLLDGRGRGTLELEGIADRKGRTPGNALHV